MNNENKEQIKLNLHGRNMLGSAASQETQLKPTKQMGRLEYLTTSTSGGFPARQQKRNMKVR